ncbi:NADH-dependent flavin oxidoreductase, partial [Streptococcus suis]
MGVDYLQLSLSHVFRPSLRNPEAPEPIIHSVIKKINGRVPLIAVGGIQTYQDVERILAEDIPLFSV